MERHSFWSEVTEDSDKNNTAESNKGLEKNEQGKEWKEDEHYDDWDHLYDDIDWQKEETSGEGI